MNEFESNQKPITLAICMVKNEQDLIEAFVRHNIRFLDHLVIVDNGSVDKTRKILTLLSVEFPNLLVSEDNRFGYDQSNRMTNWLREYQAKFQADYVFALDADEFLDVHVADSFYELLRAIPRDGYGLIPWCTYVITPDSEGSVEIDPLRAMNHRRRQEFPPRYKAVLRLDRGSADNFKLTQGNHSVRSEGGQDIPGVRIHGLRILHYPVRSIDQIVSKSTVGWMAYLAVDPRAGESKLGDQWRANFEEFICDEPMSHRRLCEMSLLYTQEPRKINWANDIVLEPSRLVYERRYSTGQALCSSQLISRSWEQSVTGSRRYSPSVKLNGLLKNAKLNENVSNDPSSEPQAARSAPCSEVEVLLAAGRHQEALDHLQLTLVKGETAELWNDWATIQFALNNMDKAELGFRRALQLDFKHRQAAINLGCLFLSCGKLSEGMALLDQHANSLTEAEKSLIAQLANSSSPVSGEAEAVHVMATQNEADTVKPARAKRKYLVVVRAGDASLHPSWLEGDAYRTWDLIVHSFGKTCPWQDEEGVEIIRATGADILGPKLRAMHSLYQQRRELFKSYDYVCFPDDDLAISLENMNLLFFMCEHFGLDYAQPALTHDSYMASWAITMENTSFLLRYTNFVEVMSPVFSRSYLEQCIPTFIENVSGYGLDILWSSWISSPWKMGIVDACPVRHTRPSFSGQLYKNFAERGVNPDQELIDLINKWHLISESEKVPGRVVVPSANILGGVLADQTRITIADGQGIELLRALQNGFPDELKTDPNKIINLLYPIMVQTLQRHSGGDADPDRPKLELTHA
jgi:glycosyltransferase involved in cell wall biosynthesis